MYYFSLGLKLFFLQLFCQIGYNIELLAKNVWADERLEDCRMRYTDDKIDKRLGNCTIKYMIWWSWWKIEGLQNELHE